MKTLTRDDLKAISGGNGLGDGIACVGSIGVMLATDGAAAAFGGVAALGTCVSAEDDFLSAHPYYDNGVQCVEW